MKVLSFLSLFLFCTVAWTASSVTTSVWVAFDYHLHYQVSVEDPCREPGYNHSEICYIQNNSHQLVVEQIELGAPVARSYIPYHENNKRDAQIIQVYSGFLGQPIFGPIETIVAMDAHPNGTVYELTSNSSIYDQSSARLVNHLHGCTITKQHRWSATFDPTTSIFHIFNSKGKHYIVPDLATGICTAAIPIQAGIVGVSYAVSAAHPRTSHVYALNNITNSFGTLNLATGAFTQVTVIQKSLGDGFEYNFDATYLADGTLKVLLQENNSFYKLNTKTGKVSAAFTASFNWPFQSFTFPAPTLSS